MRLACKSPEAKRKGETQEQEYKDGLQGREGKAAGRGGEIREKRPDHRPVSAVRSGLLLSHCKREAVRRLVRRRVTEAQDGAGAL